METDLAAAIYIRWLDGYSENNGRVGHRLRHDKGSRHAGDADLHARFMLSVNLIHGG